MKVVCVWSGEIDRYGQLWPGKQENQSEQPLSCHFGQRETASRSDGMRLRPVRCACDGKGFAHKATSAQATEVHRRIKDRQVREKAKIVGRRMKKTGVRQQHLCPMNEDFDLPYAEAICRQKTSVMVGLEENPTYGSKT